MGVREQVEFSRSDPPADAVDASMVAHGEIELDLDHGVQVRLDTPGVMDIVAAR